MARILSDKEIEKLLDHEIISEGDRNQIRANSYVFRLGKKVRFFSTGERKSGEEGDILEIDASDSALVHSFETINFSKSKIEKLYEGNQLSAFLTPTTTLVREGLQLPTTKIDPGYSGDLNWTIRNSSMNLIQLEMGEPLFKATFFLLMEDEEIPDKLYGERVDRDYYQDKTGIVESKRRLPVDVDKRNKIRVSSKGTEFERLKQSGFPYDFIATQLQKVGDQLLIVSKDFARIDDKFEKQNRELSQKIDKIEEHVLSVIDNKIGKFLGDVDTIIFTKLVYSLTVLLSILLALGAGVKYLIDKNLSDFIAPIASILALIGFAIFGILRYLRGQKK